SYSVSKVAAERLSHCYHHKYDLPVVSVRPFNIYGPLQVGEGAIHIFVRNAVNNDDIFIDGNGSQVRAWCYIEDFIEGVMGCIKNRKGAVGKVFNLGNPGAAVNMTKLAKKIVEITGSGSKIRFRDNARTDIQYRGPDISRARKILSFRPSVSLDSGLKRTISWYRENPV
ncbi:MAG: GDP-mannose 4,6-dehydratase, partial [Candidatus Omnitrophota bacterium]|nr:GDP-mannose 4,6-dehydratase [Candidatus Omnitrophota bacterium]